MEINFRKFIKPGLLHLSRERIMTYAVLKLFVIFLILLALDAIIFRYYYRIAVEPARPSVTGRVEISQQKLDKVLEIIKKRETLP